MELRIEPDKTYTVAEVARFLRLHERTLYRLIAERKFPYAFKIGRSWRVYGRDLLDLREKQK